VGQMAQGPQGHQADGTGVSGVSGAPGEAVASDEAVDPADDAQDWSWVYESDDWVPPVIDPDVPSVARMYDYYLGGKDNYPVDREAAEAVLAVLPDGRDGARANRAFLLDTVRSMAEAGIRQFIDLGTGIPTSPNVHEIVRQVQPGAAVLYVDNDPIVLAHNRVLLREDDRIVTIARDLRQPESVLTDPKARALLDFSEPVGLLMVAVLHFVDLSAAPAIVSRYLRELAPGSRLAISAACRDGIDPGILQRLEAVYQASSSPIIYRTRAQIEELFGDLELLPPGLRDLYVCTSARGLGGVAIKH
jgi:S-adenosyl methyltransferase